MAGQTSLLAAAAGIAAVLAGCASGPSDFVDRLPALAGAPEQPVLSADDRERLAADLDATAERQASEGRAAAGTLPSAMALTIIRQQQEEEARALLDAAAVPEDPAAPPCDPAVDASCAPSAE